MQAIEIHRWCSPEELVLSQVSEPACGPEGVHIRVRAAAVSHSLSLLVAGRYQRKPTLPFVPGNTAAGEVIAIGSDVTRLRLGDYVLASLEQGALAEQVVAHQDNVYAIPERIPFAEANTLNAAYNSVAAALTWPRLLDLQHGQSLLVTGAADGVGGALFQQVLRCMAPEGRVLPIGFAGGDISQIPANLLLVKNFTICGLSMGYYKIDARAHFAGRMRSLFAQLGHWWEEGKIRPVIAGRNPLENVPAAFAQVLNRSNIGHIVTEIA